MSSRLYRAAGLMSGTSMDGIDAALIETDGERHIRPLSFISRPYDESVRAQLREAVAHALAADAPVAEEPFASLSRRLTMLHAEAIGALGGSPQVIGFHGHTVAHRPDRGWTWQIGDGALLAQMVRCEVVDDFRSADVAAGGQGAPLLPAYHRARAEIEADEPALGVLNLGGVGNLTWLEADGSISGFDTGPGNALIDDWVREGSGLGYDEDGILAAAGTVQDDRLMAMLDLDWFDEPPPKSLDRNDFSLAPVRGLSLEDGAATLSALTAETVRLALAHIPTRPERLLVTGGGRRNPVLMQMIRERTGLEVKPVEDVGWNGDALEAEGFAWFAVRHLRGLPTSFPEISGCSRRITGGTLHLPS